MAYLSPEFRHDIFISYSHGDFDGAGSSPLKQWATNFVDELRYELQFNDDEIQRNLAMFIDESHRPGQGVDPTSPLTDQLSEEIASSALLAVLMCPQYVKSKWCTQELAWWMERHGKDLARSDRRIFPVRVAPTPKEDWPAPLLDDHAEPPVGFLFHPKGAIPGAARPFKWRGVNTDTEAAAFRDALVELAGRLTVRLREFRDTLVQQRNARLNAQRLQGDSGQVLYLYARARDAMYWDRAYQALDAQGYVVVPEGPEEAPADDKAWRRVYEERVTALVGSDALLLVAGDLDSMIHGDLVSVGRSSRHAAKARSDKLLPCAVLDVGGGGLRNERTKAAARKLGINWLDVGTANDWMVLLRTWLAQAGGSLERTA